MEKGQAIRINEVIEGAKFQNLPAFLDKNGKISYPLNSWAVAELIAKKIQDDIKPIVTVNFNTVDVGYFLLELNNGVTFTEADDPEQKILDYVFGETTHDL